ncbi:MAG: DUF87 domain-containing protein, partial [Thermoplasmata archaeon]|nr:DUF87 domain-containing protein [Thermoplasmata archaeon]
ASPVFLDRFAHGSHSWGIFGATGSGKTFAAALTILRSRWMVPDLQVYVVDPLGEFSDLAPFLGGTVLSLGPNAPTRLNPLDLGTTGGDPVEKTARVATLLRALFPSLRDEEAARLDSALHSLYENGDEAPTWGTLSDRIALGAPAGDRLSGLFEVFRTGSLAHLNGPTTADLGRSPLILNLEGVAAEHLPFHVTYLLDGIVGQLRKRPGPKLVVVDECHLLTRFPATSEFLDRLVRLVRHFEAGMLLLSQNPDDFLSSESGRSLLRNLRATFLLRLPEVSNACREFFQLTQPEAEWLPRARLPREAGYSEGLLRSGPSHLPVAIIASTAEFDALSRGPPRPGHQQTEP